MKPSVVLIGLDQVFLDEVVQGLSGEKKDQANDAIDWTIDTKYYTADVQLCPVNSKKLVEESVANSAQVLILLLDPSQVCSGHRFSHGDERPSFRSTLEPNWTVGCRFSVFSMTVKRNCLWPVESMLYPTVNARASWIVGMSLSLSLAISRTDIKQWCTEHEYELLELEKSTASETEETEEEDDDNADDDHQRKKIRKEICYTKDGLPLFRCSLSRCLWHPSASANTAGASMAKHEFER